MGKIEKEKDSLWYIFVIFFSWIRDVFESSPNNVFYVAHSPPSTASVSDVLQILFLEDGLLAFYSAKTQDVLLSVRSLIDDLILCIFIKRKESDFQTKNSHCFHTFWAATACRTGFLKYLSTNFYKLNKCNWFLNTFRL